MSRSIQRHTTRLIVMSVCAVMLCSAFLLDWLVAKTLQSNFDQALRDQSHALELLTEQDEDGVDFEFSAAVMPEFGSIDSRHYFQVWDSDRTVVAKSPSLGERDLPFPEQAIPDAFLYDAVLPDGRAGRYIESTFYPRKEVEDSSVKIQRSGTEFYISIAVDRTGLVETLWKIRGALVATMLLLMMTTGLFVRQMIAAGMRPIKQLAIQVSGIDDKNLSVRVKQPSNMEYEELQPVVEGVNTMLSRLEGAFERERRFASYAAHELRTPVAELKTLSDVGLLGTSSVETTQLFFADVKGISVQMERLIEGLLMLSRLDAGLEQPEQAPTDLCQEVKTCWLNYCKERSVTKTWVFDRGGEVWVRTVPSFLRLLLKCLLENACDHSPDGAEIEVSIRIEGQQAWLDIANAAPALDKNDLPKLVERFWRPHDAKKTVAHSGLGLTLADALVKGLRGHLNLRLDARHRFMAEVGPFELERV